MNETKKKKPSPGVKSKLAPNSRTQLDTVNSNDGPAKPPTPRSSGSGDHFRGPNKHPVQSRSQQQQRSQPYDRVRRIVQEEGRTARNLITWSVPIENAERSSSRNSQRDVQRKSVRLGSASSLSNAKTEATEPRDRTSSPAQKILSSQATKKDLRARYWAFLFDNLKRAVDEVYSTCETDESVVECKEVIMILEQCTNDFKSLIERLKILKAFENADKKDRPTSVAWEVRKISPAKHLLSSPTAGSLVKDRGLVIGAAARSINFTNLPSQSQSDQNQVCAARVLQPRPLGSSWADKVKNRPSSTNHPLGVTQSVPATALSSTQPSEPTKEAEVEVVANGDHEEEEDTEGWETVQKGKHGKLKKGTSGSTSRLSTCSSTSATSRDSHISSARGGRPTSLPTTPAIRPQTSSPSAPLLSVAPIKTSLSEDSAPPTVPSIEAATPPTTLEAPTTMTKVAESATTPRAVGNVGGAGVEPAEVVSVNGGVIGHELLSPADDEEDLNSCILKDEEEKALDTALASLENEEEHLNQELQKTAALQEASQEEDEKYLEDQAISSTTEHDMSDSELTLSSSQHLDFETMVKLYEAEREKGIKAWGDLVEEEDLEVQSRTPGRSVHIHEKLSSPSRKRSLLDSRKRHEEKQAKAHEQRERWLHDRGERIKTLTSRVEEVRGMKEKLVQQKKELMEKRLEQANEKRRNMLEKKVRRAHEEKTKASEIAFIMVLEAQNKKHEILTKYQESEARLQDLQEERHRKHEEKLAKETAAEERRKAMEAERQARLQEMQTRRQAREVAAELNKAELANQKMEARRTKEKEHEDRMAALQAQHQHHIEELQKKIKQKQDDTDRRHQENLQQIREKAFEMSILRHSTEDHSEAPAPVLYVNKKFCRVCNAMIPSEVYLISHLRGKKHQAALQEAHLGKDLSKGDIETFNLLNILDAPRDRPDPQVTQDRERQKALRKRCKKLRQRMNQRATEYENSLTNKQPPYESEHRAKLQKVIKDLNKLLSSPDKGPWPQSKVAAVDRSLGEVYRIMDKKVQGDQLCFRVNGGLTTLLNLLEIANQSTKDLPPVIPIKTLILVANVFRLCSRGNYDNCHYALFSNKLAGIIDVLIHRLNQSIPENLGALVSQSVFTNGPSALPQDSLGNALLNLLSSILGCLARSHPTSLASEMCMARVQGGGTSSMFMSRAMDMISYVTSIGVVDKLSVLFHNVSGVLEENCPVVEFITHGVGVLTNLVRLLSARSVTGNENNDPTGQITQRPCSQDDPTQLMSTLRDTAVCGIVPLMYGLLLHRGTPARCPNTVEPPDQLPGHVTAILLSTFRLLNSLASLDLTIYQNTLGSEGMSLEMRHITSYLLWHCVNCPDGCEDLLHEVILSTGHFTLLNMDNQMVIRSGQPPCVLQQLCQLPFQYFSDPGKSTVLFPTLIACCYQCSENMAILQKELSPSLLANYLEEKLTTLQEQQQNSLPRKPTSTTLEKEPDFKFHLSCRLPKMEWSKAKNFFNVK